MIQITLNYLSLRTKKKVAYYRIHQGSEKWNLKTELVGVYIVKTNSYSLVSWISKRLTIVFTAILGRDLYFLCKKFGEEEARNINPFFFLTFKSINKCSLALHNTVKAFKINKVQLEHL